MRRLGQPNAVLAAGLGEEFRLDSFLRAVMGALHVEGAVPRLSAAGADSDCSGAPSDECEVAGDSGAGTGEGTNTEADEDDEDGDECMHDEASEQHLAACGEQRRVAANAPAPPR